MDYPTPDNLGGVPVWSNYLYSQLVTASMGLLSPRIVQAGLQFEGVVVTLHFRMESPIAGEYPEIREIVDQFNDLTGWILDVRLDVRDWVNGVERGIDWTYHRYLGDEAIS